MTASPEYINQLQPNQVFVFGSNLSGIHGKGAAKTARRWGAVWGMGSGRMGQTYGIPTKGVSVRQTLPVDRIKDFVDHFLEHARSEPQTQFLVTEIGCGLAGYKPRDIAPLFAGAPDNVLLPARFIRHLQKHPNV